MTYAFWLMTVLSCALGLGLLAQDHESSLRLKMSTVGAGVLSAALFSAFVTLFINRESKAVLKASLEDLFEDQHTALLELVTSTARLHLPTNEYPPTDGFDRAFMADLMEDIRTSSTIEFRGSTAKWIAPYVNLGRRALTEVSVLMINPLNANAVNQRAADRLLLTSHARRTLEEVAEEIRQEIARTVVAMFDVRHKCKIGIRLSSTQISVVRLERFDDAIYVALYHAQHGRAAVNPTTYRYARGSLPYETHSLELARQLQAADIHLEFDLTQDDNYLISSLQTLGYIDCNVENIARYRKEAATFQGSFFGKMKKLSD